MRFHFLFYFFYYFLFLDEAVEIEFQWKAFKGVIFWGRKKNALFFIFIFEV